MDDRFIEAFLMWRGEPDMGVDDWFYARGFLTSRRGRGLLVIGDRTRFEEAFGPLPVERPAELPLPTALQALAASIEIPPSPSNSR